ncbi:MAG: crotonase/enoyl-CoA hydratase family protein [Burkholderiales bacterium]|jgi:enoyl-CoA hydratase
MDQRGEGRSTVSVDRDGPVWIVTIDRPEVRNAVDGRTARALHDAFLAFDADETASVAILAGRGDAFCAGADLKAIAAGDPEKRRALGGRNTLAPMGPTRLALSKPVIAAIEGPAVAGGMELALWADLRVVARGAVFGIYCRRFGVPLIDLGTIRLPRLIGQSRAMDLILTGRPVTAEEALEIGLANRLVPAGSALTESVALARQLAAFPQRCMRADRRSVLAQWSLDEDQAIDAEMQGGLDVIASGETVRGAAAFARGQGRHGEF